MALVIVLCFLYLGYKLIEEAIMWARVRRWDEEHRKKR